MFDLQGFGHLLLSGAMVTVKLALTSLVIGFIFGLLGATAKLSGIWILQKIANVYTTVMRGIPELLLIMFLYFGGTIILNSVLQSMGYDEYIDISKFWAGVLALSIAFGAYATEVLRMAIQEIPTGQWEAAKAIGMRPIQTFFRAILPQVWQLALPGLGNLFLVLIKDTALVSVVGLQDLMYFSKKAAESTKEQFTFYMAAALIYLAMTVVVTAVLMYLERQANPAKRYADRLRKLNKQNKKNNQSGMEAI